MKLYLELDIDAKDFLFESAENTLATIGRLVFDSEVLRHLKTNIVSKYDGSVIGHWEVK